MKKIGIIAIVLVLALAVLGVGYAGWKDNIEIHGTLDTGEVDLQLTSTSGVDACKNMTTDALVFTPWWADAGQVHVPGMDVIATAGAYETAQEDVLNIVFDNIFPLPEDQYAPSTSYNKHPGWWKADIWWTYHGMPAKISKIDFQPFLERLKLLMDTKSLEIDYVLNKVSPAGSGPEVSVPADIGTQIHDGERLQLVVWIWVVQCEGSMNQHVEGNVCIEVTQWNEVGPA